MQTCFLKNYSEQEIVRRVAVGPVFVGTLEACCPNTDCTTCTKTRFATQIFSGNCFDYAIILLMWIVGNSRPAIPSNKAFQQEVFGRGQSLKKLSCLQAVETFLGNVHRNIFKQNYPGDKKMVTRDFYESELGSS